MTLPETMLWNQVRSSRLGFKVRRQHPIGPYVVDFYSNAGRLVVEIDGEAHNRGDNPGRDLQREDFLKLNGYNVLRIPAAEVLQNLDGVIAGIVAAAGSPLHHPSDGPPPHAGEEL